MRTVLARMARRSVMAWLTLALAVILAIGPSLAAEKPFQRGDLDDGSIRFEAALKAESGQLSRAAADYRRDGETAAGRGDQRGAARLFGQAASAEPQNAATWTRLSRAFLAVTPNDDRERFALRDKATHAAYLGYRRAASRSGEEYDALVQLGRVFQARQVWRPALDAYRYALDIRETPDIRAQYEELRGQHGFRLIDYSIDSDAAAPRACFQFSEDLPGRTDFSPFVAVDEIARPALSASGSQICVEGLKHGDRYAMQVRPGLPSTVGEALARLSTFSIYVRDRSPQVRFTAKAYVLPRTGQKGIPLVSVNTRAISIEIYRIGDRSITGTVLSEEFQTMLDRYTLDTLRDQRGQEVWKGTMQTADTLNADFVTAFPIGEAVGKLEQGVYVMVAQAGAQPLESYDTLATQWFIVSDLGLSALSTEQGVHVAVHSLASAEPKPGIEVRLLAKNNEILATERTGADGAVQFAAALSKGAGGLQPGLVVAVDPAGDYSFLDIAKTAFDLSDRGVKGRLAPGASDAFVVTERGVYRSGETVHVTALLRDAKAQAQTGTPLVLVMERNDGVEYRRQSVPDQGVGARTWSVPLTSGVPTGTWRVKAFTDPKRAAVGETTFMVEDYVPERLDFELAARSKTIGPDTPADLSVEGRFLYGATASDLALEGDVMLALASERPGFAGYRFGITDEEFTGAREPLDDLPQTDANGRARFSVQVPGEITTQQPLDATVFIRMVEPSGRAVERKIVLPVTPQKAAIGIRPAFGANALRDGDQAAFDLIHVLPDGRAVGRGGLRWEVVKLESRYQWYRKDGYWEYEAIKSEKRIASGEAQTNGEAPARIAVPVEFGRYRIEAKADGADGPFTSLTFNVGFYAEASADTPDQLDFAVDRTEAKAGDTVMLAVTTRHPGQVTVQVVADRVLSSRLVAVNAGTTRIPVTVDATWAPGAYVLATYRRPLDIQASRMPGRAIGLAWVSVDRAARTLALDMTAPQLARPNAALKVPLRITGLQPGEEARVTVAAVDVGILNLTGYKAPDPADWYFGQRRLAAEVRDLYGQLLDGMQGTRGDIKVGGDEAAAELQGSPPSQAPLALFSGLVTPGADGSAEVTFDIPGFAGTVRLMAMAVTAGRVGHAARDVIIRDPVVLTATLPRFMLTGDRSALRVDLDNVEGAAGDYRVEVTSSGPVAMGAMANPVLRLNARQRGSLDIPVDARLSGAADVAVRVTGPGGFESRRTYALGVRPPTQIASRKTVRTLGRGESFTLTPDIFNEFVAGTGVVSVSIGTPAALDAPALIKALERYPLGCTEQVVALALPLLYVGELAQEAQLSLAMPSGERIAQAIELVLSRQNTTGGFGLWSSSGGEDPWLDAYVTDFLTRAREKGHAVPDVAFRQAIDRLRNQVSLAPEPDKDGAVGLAYTYYVLARNGAAPVGDLRYLVDTKLGDVRTAIARAQLAAALALVGDRVRAEKAFAAALDLLKVRPSIETGRSDFGSQLRDAAALVALAAETSAPRPPGIDAVIATAVTRIESARQMTAISSTQENAWLVLAARALARERLNVSVVGGKPALERLRLSFDLDGQTSDAPTFRSYRAADLAQRPVKITNLGETPMQVVLNAAGAPTQFEPAAERGFKLERRYFTLEGEPANPARVRQNQRLVVVLTATEPKPELARVAIIDHLPAGFEIDNPALVSSGDATALDWIENGVEPAHAEFRDDRFVAAFDRTDKDPAVFAVAYVVRAVAPGRYVHPQAMIEDMYRPDRFARTASGTVQVEAAR
jgi:uncharacterized protein YfaS (alpha-2-macroglobulin family)